MVNYGHNSFNRYLTSNPLVEAMCGTTSSGTSKEPCHLQAKLGEPADFQSTGFPALRSENDSKLCVSRQAKFFPSPGERIECSMSTSELVAFKVRAHPVGKLGGAKPTLQSWHYQYKLGSEVQNLHFNLGVANTSMEVRCKKC